MKFKVDEIETDVNVTAGGFAPPRAQVSIELDLEVNAASGKRTREIVDQLIGKIEQVIKEEAERQ